MTHLDRPLLLQSNLSTKINDRLHALHLALDDNIEVLLTSLGDAEEVDRTDILC